jgi:hypothetical protein
MTGMDRSEKIIPSSALEKADKMAIALIADRERQFYNF